MPSPTFREVHVGTALDAFAIQYRNEEMIAEDVFRVAQVRHRSDEYYIFGRQVFIDNTVPTAIGTPTPRIQYTTSTCTYTVQNYKLAHPVPDSIVADADSILDPLEDGIGICIDNLMLGQELRVAALTTGGSSNWKGSASTATQWNNDASDPFGDLNTAIGRVAVQIGRLPNTIVMSGSVWWTLMDHPDVQDRLKYQGLLLTPEAFSARLPGGPRILVGNAVQNTAREGQAETMSFAWSGNGTTSHGVWVGWVPPATARRSPAAGYILQFEKFSTDSWREDDEEQTVVRAKHAQDEIITGSMAGTVISQVI